MTFHAPHAASSAADPPTQPEPESLHALMRRIVADCADMGAAVMAVLAATDTNARLRAELIRLGACQAVRSLYAADRRVAFVLEATPPRPRPPARPDDHGALLVAARATLYDTWRLYGGKPIGEAEAADLLASARAREAQAMGNLRAAEFERLVARAIKGKGTVRQVLSEMQLTNLRRQAAKTVRHRNRKAL